MAEQIVSVGFGKATFSASTVSLSAFVVSNGFDRDLPSKIFKRHGQVQRFPVSSYPEINGSLHLDSIKVPDGTVILLMSSHKHGASPIRDAAIFIAARSDGPGFTVHANLTETRESLIGNTFLMFQGRGDILSVGELESYGVTPYKNFINAYTDEEEIAECFVVTEVAKALSGKPDVERLRDADGEMVIVQKKPVRKLRLRGN